MKILPIILVFIITGCFEINKSNLDNTNLDSPTITNRDLIFNSQQKPIVTFNYITLKLENKIVDLATLDSLKVVGSSRGNSSEYVGEFIRKNTFLKILKDPKDKYFILNWTTIDGDKFSANIEANEGVIRL